MSACAQATKGVVTLHKYYGELSCLLEAYSRATPLVVLPPSLQWRFRFGDETVAMKGAYLTKARKVGTHDQAVLLPINTHRHARDLRPLQRITEHKLPTFLRVRAARLIRPRGAAGLGRGPPGGRGEHLRERAGARSKNARRVGGLGAARRHGRAAGLPPGARVRAVGVSCVRAPSKCILLT